MWMFSASCCDCKIGSALKFEFASVIRQDKMSPKYTSQQTVASRIPMLMCLNDWIERSTLLAASKYCNLNTGIDVEERDIETLSVLNEDKKNKLLAPELFFNDYICWINI